MSRVCADRRLQGKILREMDAHAVREAVDRIRWYHTIDLGNGIVTAGVDATPVRLGGIDLPTSLEGLSVLDIGAWDGFFSFEAERRGAARVVAADWYSWRGVGWGTENGKAGFELARDALGSRVEDVEIDVMDLSPERVGTFDVVLFLGVLTTYATRSSHWNGLPRFAVDCSSQKP